MALQALVSPFSPHQAPGGIPGAFSLLHQSCLSSSGGSSSSRQGEERGLSLGSVGTGPGLPAQCVCSCSESLAALGQLMVGGKPPGWLAPSREQAAHSDVDGGEQLCEHVSLRSLTFCLSQNPLVSFFSVCAVMCPLHSALGREGCHLCKS